MLDHVCGIASDFARAERISQGVVGVLLSIGGLGRRLADGDDRERVSHVFWQFEGARVALPYDHDEREVVPRQELVRLGVALVRAEERFPHILAE